MFAIESFTAAIVSYDYDRAKEMITVMTPEHQIAAQEIWEFWVPKGVSNAAV